MAVIGDIVLCSWARHFTPTVPLSTQVYKWVQVNILGVTLRWTGNTPCFMLRKPRISSDVLGHWLRKRLPTFQEFEILHIHVYTAVRMVSR